MKKLYSCLLAVVFGITAQAAIITVERQDFAAGADISNAVSTPPLVLSPVPSPAELADVNLVGNYASAGRFVFAITNTAASNFRTSWFKDDFLLRADVASPVPFVSVFASRDAFTDNDAARVEIDDALNNPPRAQDIPNLANTFANVSFNRELADIDYMIAANPNGSSGESFLPDGLQFGPVVPEPATILLFGAGINLTAIVQRRRRG